MLDTLKRPSPAFRDIAARGYGDCLKGCAFLCAAHALFETAVQPDEIAQTLPHLAQIYINLGLFLGSLYTTGAAFVHKGLKPAARVLLQNINP